MKHAAVLGSPVEHSLSPVLHRAAYAELGLAQWSYEARECTEVELADLLAGLDGSWVGLSLTMPLKRAVLPLLDEVSELGRAVGAVNTVTFPDGRRGDNTDVHGMVAALREAGITGPRAVTVLGGGATACSALAAVGELGLAKATVLVRDTSRAARLVEAAARLDVTASVGPIDALGRHLDTDLLISTLPAGAADGLAASVTATCRPTALFDVVYAPWPTRLARAVVAAGGTVVGGLPMLVHQAARQVELMTGCARAPLAAMRKAAEAAVA